MGYQGEFNSIFGSEEFEKKLTEEDFNYYRDELPKMVEEMAKHLSPSDIHKVNPAINYKLVTVSVDAGQNEIFPNLEDFSMGVLRVSSSSDDIKTGIPHFIHLIRDYHFSRDNSKRAFDLFLQEDLIAKFMEKTGITPEDLGKSWASPGRFLRVARDISEWAYILNVLSLYGDVRMVVAKDGGLMQENLTHEFNRKLKEYFNRANCFVVGVLKSTALFKDGVSRCVLSDWMEMADGSFYFQVPNPLMEHVFRHQKFWLAEEAAEGKENHKASYALGRRYILRLLPNEIYPLDGVIAIDVSTHIQPDSSELRDIMATILNGRSYLFGGSFIPVIEAHSKASISKEIKEQIEATIRKKAKTKYLGNSFTG